MPKTDQLKPWTKDDDRAKEANKLSRIARNRNFAEANNMRKVMALKIPESDKDAAAFLEDHGIPANERTIEMLMDLKQAVLAGRGDTSAYVAVNKKAGYLTDRSKVDMDLHGEVVQARITSKELQDYARKRDAELGISGD